MPKQASPTINSYGGKKMKRTLCAILALILAVSMFSCSSDDGSVIETSAQTTAPATPETEVVETEEPGLPEPDLPYETYEGEEFIMMSRIDDAYTVPYFYVEDQNGELVNDAVYKRNLETEEKFGVDIVGRDDAAPYDTVAKAISSGDFVCHVFWDKYLLLFPEAMEGYYLNLNTVPHLNFDADYWDTNIIRDLQIMDKLYLMNSDIYMYFDCPRFIYFNKGLINQYQLESPYEHVHNNTWTLDTFAEMCKAVNEDLNGDGKFDNQDRFGLWYESPQYFLVGAGIEFSTVNSEGIPEVNQPDERSVAVLEKLKRIVTSTEYSLDINKTAAGADTKGLNIFDYGRTRFAADYFLFVQNGAGCTIQFKDMESDYGIVPNPKFDENQEDYYHLMDPYSYAMSIPNNNTELDKTGMILEWMSWKSNQLVIPAYYEITLFTKRFRDEEAKNMLEIVKSSVRYDISYFSGMDVISTYGNSIAKGNLISSFEKRQKLFNKQIQKIIDKFEKIQH